MPQSKFSVWILILTLCALLTACGGSSGSDPQPEPHQPPPGQSTPGDDNQPDVPGGNNEPEPEPEPITTPNSFSFAPKNGVAPGEVVESDPITLTGMTARASISITNGEYKLGNGDFTAEDGHIEPGQSLTVRATAPSSADTVKEVVVTVGGVSGRFIIHTLEDSEPPEASIVFPNVISATYENELTIRGTAEDALSEIAEVTLTVTVKDEDGDTISSEEHPVTSEDNFATWQVTIPLEVNTEHTITVSVEDEHGNVDAEAATAVVHQQAWEDAFPDDEHVFERAEGMTYDEGRHRVFVADQNTDSVIEVDLLTGERKEFFSGNGDFSSATALVIDRPQNRLLVANRRENTVYSLNLEGELQPTLLNSRTYPDEEQPLLWSPMGIALDPQNPDRAFITSNMGDNLAELDLSTRRRTLLSDNETPDGENPFNQPRGLLVDHNNNRILVGSPSGTKTVFSVDAATGERTIFSGVETTDSGIEFQCPASLGSDRISERVLVGDCFKGIISVDIKTEKRTLIRALIDPQPLSHQLHLYVEEGWEVLYYVDSRHRALLMLDLVTEEYVVLSKARPD